MDGSVLDDSRPLPPVLSDITYQGKPVMEEKRQKHNFTLSHLLTLPSLSFSTLPSLTPLMLSLFFTPSSFVLCFSFPAVTFSPSSWVTLCFKAALPHLRASLFRFLFVKRCLLCTVCQSKAISGLSRLPPPTMSPSVSPSLCLCFISLSHHR